MQPRTLPGLVALLCLPFWAPFPSVTLRTLSGGFAGTSSLFPLWEAQHCGQDGRVPCHHGEVPAGDWGKALYPDLTSHPPFAHEQDAVAQGVPLVSGFLSYCTV